MYGHAPYTDVYIGGGPIKLSHLCILICDVHLVVLTQ